MRKTGLAYHFIITQQKADGTARRRRRVRVLALSTAQAWQEFGQYVHRYMRGPTGRLVVGAELQRPQPHVKP